MDEKLLKKNRMMHTLFIFILLTACVASDQATKYLAHEHLQGQPAIGYMGDTFRLVYAENNGAFLSLGAKMPPIARTTILVVCVSIFLIAFLLFVIFSNDLNLPARLSCSLIIGGGFGNLIDRILNQGAVVDFMNLGIGPVRTGIFNIADVLIMAGLFFLVISVLIKRRTPEHQ